MVFLRTINNSVLDNVLRDPTNKALPCSSHDLLLLQLYFSMMNFSKFFENTVSAYETALYINSRKNMLNNKGKLYTKAYKRGCILMVDLGTDTYGSEFSYFHPAVVIHNEYRRVFIVPCTSQPAKINSKTGVPFDEFVQGEISDGFQKTTTVLLNEARFVDKTRIRAELGLISKSFYDKLYNSLFERLFENKKYAIHKMEEIIDSQKNQIESLLNENEQLKKTVATSA